MNDTLPKNISKSRKSKKILILVLSLITFFVLGGIFIFIFDLPVLELQLQSLIGRQTSETDPKSKDSEESVFRDLADEKNSTDVLEEIVPANDPTHSWNGPEFYVKENGIKTLVSIEGRVSEINENQIVITRASQSEVVLRDEINGVYREKFVEEKFTPQPIDYFDIKVGDVVSFTLDSGYLLHNTSVTPEQAENW